MRELKDRVAVVTGAASGIGFATASRFAHEGMHVVLVDIQKDALDHAVNQLRLQGFEVIGIQTDVSKWNEVQLLADRTMEAYGQVNVLHNNAGVVRAGKIEELTMEDWEWVLGVDLWSVIYGVKAFLPLIKQSGDGHIINTSSSAGLQSSPNIGPYNVAKFGVVAMTETLQQELAEEESPIGVSVLCPGATVTQICQSERNRPTAAEPTETNTDFVEKASEVVAAGLQPSVVADMVINAIKKQEFWILPHPQWIEVLEQRIAQMKEDRKLFTGFGG